MLQLYESDREYKILHVNETQETWQSKIIGLLSKSKTAQGVPTLKEAKIDETEFDEWTNKRQSYLDWQAFTKKNGMGLLVGLFAVPFLVMTWFDNSDRGLLISIAAGAALALVGWIVGLLVGKIKKQRSENEEFDRFVEQLQRWADTQK